MAPLHLPIADRLDLIETIWDHVLGHCYSERHPFAMLSPGIERHVREHAAARELPQLATLFAEHDTASLIAVRHDPDARFERNLARLLDAVWSRS